MKQIKKLFTDFPDSTTEETTVPTGRVTEIMNRYGFTILGEISTSGVAATSTKTVSVSTQTDWSEVENTEIKQADTVIDETLSHFANASPQRFSLLPPDSPEFQFDLPDIDTDTVQPKAEPASPPIAVTGVCVQGKGQCNYMIPFYTKIHCFLINLYEFLYNTIGFLNQ